MEVLSVLEEKISALVQLVQDLKKKNEQLLKDNSEIVKKNKDYEQEILSLKEATLSGSQQLDEEKKSTKVAVTDLIKVIDNLVDKEHTQ